MTPIDRVFDPKATTIPVLRYVVALADHQHFGRAAAACAVSQPTLSAQISKWERRMGVTVFERSGSGVKPNRIGDQVIAEARAILASLAALEHAASSAPPPFFGAVRIGIIPTLGPYLLPVIGPAIESRWPALDWPVTEDLTTQLLAALTNHRLDLVVMAILADLHAQHEVLPLFDEPFVAAVPAGHRLAAKREISATDLGRERLLLLDDGHCLRDQALDACRVRTLRSTGGDYRATSLETIRQLVALGRGVTLLPALAVHPDPRLAIRPLTGTRTHRSIGLVWRKGDARAPGYRELARTIRGVVPDECRRVRL